MERYKSIFKEVKKVDEKIEALAKHLGIPQERSFDLIKKEIAKVLTNTENLVYTLRELNNYSISYIHENYGLAEKVIYNSLHRAKIKIRKHFET